MTLMIPDGFVKCPHCKASIGCVCTTPKGRTVLPPHRARMELAEKRYGWVDIESLEEKKK